MNKKKLKNKINLSMPKLNKQHALLAVTLLISTLTIFLNNGLRNSEFEDRVVVEYVNEDALEELKSVGSYMSIDRKNMQIHFKTSDLNEITKEIESEGIDEEIYTSVYVSKSPYRFDVTVIQFASLSFISLLFVFTCVYLLSIRSNKKLSAKYAVYDYVFKNLKLAVFWILSLGILSAISVLYEVKLLEIQIIFLTSLAIPIFLSSRINEYKRKSDKTILFSKVFNTESILKSREYVYLVAITCLACTFAMGLNFFVSAFYFTALLLLVSTLSTE